MDIARGTHAILIGIEKYAVGDTWNLDGPALDACRFAEWLIARGVPPAQILLLLSPLESNAEEIAVRTAGLTLLPATQQSIYDTLTTEIAAASSDFLFVYWGGHGVMDNVRNRRLFCSDAMPGADKRNINLTSLVDSMRSSVFRDHSTQLIVVDACQNPVSALGWQAELPDQGFPTGRELPPRDQWLLLAASPGQKSINDDVRKTGLFSREVLELLDADANVPPDIARLRDTVAHRFETLRREKKSVQVPEAIWFRAKGDERQLFVRPVLHRKPDASTLNAQLLSGRETLQLKRIINGATLPGNLGYLYGYAAGHIPNLVQPSDSNDILDCVASLRHALRPDPLLKYLVGLASRLDAFSRDRLWAWLGGICDQYEVDLEELRLLDQELRREVLLCKVDHDYLDEGFNVQIWRYVGASGTLVRSSFQESWSFDNVRRTLQSLLPPSSQSALDGVPPIVEFMLPDDLLNHEFEALQLSTASPATIGEMYPVLVRPSERLRNKSGVRQWRSRWGRFRQDALQYDENAIHWLDWTLHPEAELDDGVHCVAIVTPSAQLVGGNLAHLLRQGVGAAVWSRGSGASSTQRPKLEVLFRGRKLCDLPDVVLDQRAAARFAPPDSEHVGRSVVLLWDDPERVPAELLWAAPTTGEAG